MFFFSELDSGSFIAFIAITASKKVEALILSMKCLSSEVALYLYKTTIQRFRECLCHVFAGVCSYYWVMLIKQLQQVFRTLGGDPSLSVHCHKVAYFSFFYRYYYVGIHLNWTFILLWEILLFL